VTPRATEGATVLARHRAPGGQATATTINDARGKSELRVRGAHRVPAPSSALRGRVMVAAIATGAFAAAAAGQNLQLDQSSDSDSASPDVTPLADAHYATSAMGVGGNGDNAIEGSPTLLAAGQQAASGDDAETEAQQLVDNDKTTEKREQHEAAKAREAAKPDFVSPADGNLSSTFGGRWGTTHYGIDIANGMGTPIHAVADGEVIEAGPASGFGLWIRVKLDDGTTHVYGHIQSYSVSAGQRIEAGDVIAKMGARGQSTGPHLHFEVWDSGGKKIDPLPWLSERGVDL